MYWNDDEQNNDVSGSQDIVEIVFQLVGKTLPNDYLGAFASALHQQAPIWQVSQLAFYIQIAGEEGNGWFRGSSPDDVIYLSRRNMLVVRGASDQSEEIQALAGITFDVDGHQVELKHKHNKMIKPVPTLYSRYVVCEDEDESVFIESVLQQLRQRNINIKKLLCGKKRSIIINQKKYQTRSLMLESLSKEDAVSIQANGLGEFQKSGCGVFVPHKSVK